MGTSSLEPLLIGSIGLLAYHNLQPSEADRIHSCCVEVGKKDGAQPDPAITFAAVVDHAYIFSLSQLRVVLHRYGEVTSPSLLHRLCQVLSLSRSVRSLLEVFPPGPQTAAVVICWQSNPADLHRQAAMVHQAVQAASPHAAPHSLTGASCGGSSSDIYLTYSSMERVLELYHIRGADVQWSAHLSPVEQMAVWRVVEQQVLCKLAVADL